MIDIENKGAKREEAKLFLNNLYGKLASTDSSYKTVEIVDDKVPGIASYAIAFTQRVA